MRLQDIQYEDILTVIDAYALRMHTTTQQHDTVPDTESPESSANATATIESNLTSNSLNCHKTVPNSTRVSRFNAQLSLNSCPAHDTLTEIEVAPSSKL